MMALTKSEPAHLDDDSAHILLVDDDRRIRELLKRYLSEHGYRVSVAASAAEASAALSGLVFDLLILDVMMPGENGLDFLARLRATETFPVLMLTARSEFDDRIKGLELGADDYLAKPFEPRELLLRIANILKRREPPPASDAVPELVRFGPFVFVIDRAELVRDGEEPVRLTQRERDLMKALALKAGETISRFDLVGADGDTSERAVDVQINRLRRKIERDPANPMFLQTVRGVGYRLVVQ
jgi:two-component system phosphate regulon response regulator OmpR